jgi:hypothetical protein
MTAIFFPVDVGFAAVAGAVVLLAAFFGIVVFLVSIFIRSG